MIKHNLMVNNSLKIGEFSRLGTSVNIMNNTINKLLKIFAKHHKFSENNTCMCTVFKTCEHVFRQSALRVGVMVMVQISSVLTLIFINFRYSFFSEKAEAIKKIYA